MCIRDRYMGNTSREMSYTGFNIQGGIQQCYPFHERVISCIKRETLPVKACTVQAEDFLECLQKRKQYALNYKIHEELHKHKILALPRYDEENDRFVIDSDLPNADVIFSQPARQQCDDELICKRRSSLSFLRDSMRRRTFLVMCTIQLRSMKHTRPEINDPRYVVPPFYESTGCS
eukprot:TRINITY_DN1008_c0_g1_i2.p2 TRINITY_DN1008_c0_g1~~TRINITY_DN1008_c0_g1_i2.p2  ORF type:complete len:176 (+),score=30.23 TRINITY_DN1008_c0_g1_i2:66-593(+)